MIELHLTGCCKDCPHFELCTDTTDFYADGVVVQRTVSVSCGHEQVCGKHQAEIMSERSEPHDRNKSEFP